MPVAEKVPVAAEVDELESLPPPQETIVAPRQEIRINEISFFMVGYQKSFWLQVVNRITKTMNG